MNAPLNPTIPRRPTLATSASPAFPPFSLARELDFSGDGGVGSREFGMLLSRVQQPVFSLSSFSPPQPLPSFFPSYSFFPISSPCRARELDFSGDGSVGAREFGMLLSRVQPLTPSPSSFPLDYLSSVFPLTHSPHLPLFTC
jgi:hypothetical protein